MALSDRKNISSSSTSSSSSSLRDLVKLSYSMPFTRKIIGTITQGIEGLTWREEKSDVQETSEQIENPLEIIEQIDEVELHINRPYYSIESDRGRHYILVKTDNYQPSFSYSFHPIKTDWKQLHLAAMLNAYHAPIIRNPKTSYILQCEWDAEGTCIINPVTVGNTYSKVKHSVIKLKSTEYKQIEDEFNTFSEAAQAILGSEFINKFRENFLKKDDFEYRLTHVDVLISALEKHQKNLLLNYKATLISHFFKTKNIPHEVSRHHIAPFLSLPDTAATVVNKAARLEAVSTEIVNNMTTKAKPGRYNPLFQAYKMLRMFPSACLSPEEILPLMLKKAFDIILPAIHLSFSFEFIPGCRGAPLKLITPIINWTVVPEQAKACLLKLYELINKHSDSPYYSHEYIGKDLNSARYQITIYDAAGLLLSLKNLSTASEFDLEGGRYAPLLNPKKTLQRLFQEVEENKILSLPSPPLLSPTLAR